MATSTTSAARNVKVSTGKKLLASAAVLGAVAAVAGLGTYGEFVGSTNVSQGVASGSAGLDVPYTTLNKPISGMLPGDSIERYATLFNPGTSTLKGIYLGTTVVEPSLLTTDHTNGLRIKIVTCSVPWTVIAGGADLCTGTETLQIDTVSLGAFASSGEKTLSGMRSTSSNGDDYVKVVLSLPATADASFQNLSATVDLRFTGVQRDGMLLED